MGSLTVSRHMTRAAGCGVFLATLAAQSPSFADGSNAAIAESLFADAKRLLDKGDAEHACPKFAESLRLAPTLGTRLNLARCYEVAGKLATAWGEFTELARLAGQAGDAKRAQIAQEHVVALEPALPHVVLQGTLADGAKLKLDGKELDAAVLGTPFALDPGDHTVEVAVVGKTSRTSSFHVDAGKSTKVDLPQLVDAVVPVEHKDENPVVEKPRDEYEVSSGKRIGGYVTVGLGVALIGVGAVFGGLTMSLADQVRTLCPYGPCPTQAGIDDNSSAHTFALLSDILIPVGVVAVGVGLYLALTSSQKKAPSAAFVMPLVGPGSGGLAAHWSF